MLKIHCRLLIKIIELFKACEIAYNNFTLHICPKKDLRSSKRCTSVVVGKGFTPIIKGSPFPEVWIPPCKICEFSCRNETSIYLCVKPTFVPQRVILFTLRVSDILAPPYSHNSSCTMVKTLYFRKKFPTWRLSDSKFSDAGCCPPDCTRLRCLHLSKVFYTCKSFLNSF